MTMPARQAPAFRAPTAEQIETVRAAARGVVPDLIDLTASIAEVPAPTGDEARRSAFVAAQMRSSGLNPSVDDLGDVTAWLSEGADQTSPVVLAAHLDTVFPAGTTLAVRRTSTHLYGPGIGDNSLGVAAMLSLPALFRNAGLHPSTGVVLAADVGEEGLGNLRGMRAVMDAYPSARSVVAIEGHNLGRLTHVAVGSHRLRITATGPGGHSWGDAGRPSAIHALARVVAELSAIPMSTSPKTSLNVGTFDGGVSVNTIAPSATCVIDLRSVDNNALQILTDRVGRVVDRGASDGVSFDVDVLGDRPAGVVPLESPIVELATRILSQLGIAASYDASSTDANVPISRSIPAVCIGLTHGGNVHREDEYILTEPIELGLTQLALLALALAGGANGS